MTRQASKRRTAAGFVVLGMVLALGGSRDVRAEASGAAKGGKYRGVIVAVSDYGQTRLQYAVKDAALLAETLLGQGGYGADGLAVLTDAAVAKPEQRPTRDHIVRGLQQMAGAGRRGDMLLFYFVGHAAIHANKAYLIPSGGQGAGHEGWLSAGEVCKVLAQSKAARCVVILDVCHDGAERVRGEPRMQASFMRSLRSGSHGVWVMTSCAVGESSLDAEWHKHGLFAHWLIRGLAGAADKRGIGNADGHVEIDELHRYVAQHVPVEANKQARRPQRPTLLSSRPEMPGARDVTRSETCGIYLASAGRGGPPPPAAAPTGAPADRYFCCKECGHGFGVTNDEARSLLRQAAKASPGQRSPLVKCPKCGKYACKLGIKCAKCGKGFTMPDKNGNIFPDHWRDECPQCGYSVQRERAVRAALKMKKAGKYDPDRIPDFIRKAVEEAEKSGEYDE